MREPTQQLIGKDGRVYTYLIHDKCTAFESGDYDSSAEKALIGKCKICGKTARNWFPQEEGAPYFCDKHDPLKRQKEIE